MSETRLSVVTEGVLDTIEQILATRCCTVEDAIRASGISVATYYKHANEEIRARMARAQAAGKLALLSVAVNGAIGGKKVKEVRVLKVVKRDENGNTIQGADGNDILEVSTVTEVERELPPDPKVALNLLRARFPEEFAPINRVDSKKVVGDGQIDKSGSPVRPENLGETLDMILGSDGTWMPDIEFAKPDPIEQPILPVDEDEPL